jgi:hypothetical protein
MGVGVDDPPSGIVSGTIPPVRRIIKFSNSSCHLPLPGFLRRACGARTKEYLCGVTGQRTKAKGRRDEGAMGDGRWALGNGRWAKREARRAKGDGKKRRA